jgi:two-component system sensor histidine kinase BaeS
VWVVRRALAPVDRLTQAARALQAGRVPERVRVTGPSEIAGLAEAFDAASEAIAGTERLRRQVIADVGHELRTPVTNLRAQIEAMQQGLTAPDAGALASLQAETRLLERVVDDFQQLTLSDAGRLSLNLQVWPLRETLEAIVAPLAAHAGAAWRVDGPAEVCARVDEERLRQVVSNLVENAVRHRPVGLELTVVVRREDPDRVAFEFSDNGPGVADADVPHIFERFYRAATTRGPAAGGSGLGLAIARGLVEAMGGSIRYTNAAAGGATFIVTLPGRRPAGRA